MLKATLCCVLVAATAAIADPWPWELLDSTPEQCPVGRGAHLTYGADCIWGVFPNADSDKTYAAFYSPFSTTPPEPPSGEWHVLDQEVPMLGYMYNTGLTFQWEEGSALYVIGSDEEYFGDGYLYWYSPDLDSWDEYDIDEDDEFSLAPGACIVYSPNPEYCSAYQVAGWIYCLPGNGKELWRYAIDPSSHTTVQGIFPPDGSVIADATPKFQWNPSSSGQYRLQVSPDEFFSLTVIDTVVYAPECQTTSELANGTYFWHVGTPDGGGWLWGDTYNFADSAGFERWSDIDEAVAEGAAMAYEADPGCWEDPSIVAVIGGGRTSLYKYDIKFDDWSETYELENTPKHQYAGTSLTTNDPTEESGWWSTAAFGGSDTSDRPWGYIPYPNNVWFEYPADDYDPFPQPLGPGATFVFGLPPWAYLTTGEQEDTATHCFYAIEPRHKKKPHGGGSQAGDVHARSRRVQVIASNHGIEVEYRLPAAARVRATLHDAVGRQVGVLDAGSQEPGTHRLSWSRNGEGDRLSSGAYFVLLDMGKEQARLKAVVR